MSSCPTASVCRFSRTCERVHRVAILYTWMRWHVRRHVLLSANRKPLVCACVVLGMRQVIIGLTVESTRSLLPLLPSIQIIPFYNTCYPCTNCTELVHSTFQCTRDDLLWGTAKF